MPSDDEVFLDILILAHELPLVHDNTFDYERTGVVLNLVYEQIQ